MEISLFFFLLFAARSFVCASPVYDERALDAFPITKAPVELERRQGLDLASVFTSCGYKSEDPSQPRLAGHGFKCAVDTVNSYWGVCPLDKTEFSDCGIREVCTDQFQCTSGCGRTELATAMQCSGSSSGYCFSELLVAATDQTYTRFNCDSTYKFRVVVAASGLVPVSGASSSATATDTGNTFSSTSTPSPTQTSSISSATSVANGPPAASSSTNVGAIVGGVVGGLALLVFGALAFYFIRRHTRNPTQPKSSLANEPPPFPGSPDVGPQKYAQYAEMEHPPSEVAATEKIQPMFEMAAVVEEPTRGSRNRTT
ncbi:hypothetical protein EJ04DRAFT_515306 [Polyplosphaeria fusca]|uniref:Uncharacterized protein n=1 Tax=Polyplosphaeria fusca TaxID=682080 RepID=A0A9P4QQ10_9PLEO|nr:hypothetical protein EJ04DRAFT_515306 [Polyplosphaeria fusca]